MTSAIGLYNGAPTLFINGTPHCGATVFASSHYVPDFAEAGLHIHNIVCDSCDWWVGPHSYDFSKIDELITAYIAQDNAILFFPRICVGYVEDSWWAEYAPNERAQARSIADGSCIDSYGDRMRGKGAGASFASTLWRDHAAHALSALISHLENGPYAERVIGYHIGASISGEWFAWNTFHTDVVEDYSESMRSYFRAWLTRTYGTDIALQTAWNDTTVTAETAEIPPPAEVEGTTLLTTDQKVIDFRRCFSACSVDTLSHLTRAAKAACHHRKVIGVFFGYYWPHKNISNPARAGHVALRNVIQLDSVDIIISPCHYDNRGMGGYMDAQSLPDTVQQYGKLFLHEIDTPTSLNDIALRPWMSHMNIPETTEGSAAIMARDWAAAATKRAAYWWMDLHDDGWFHHPAFVARMSELLRLGEDLLTHPWEHTTRVAIVLSEEACYRQKLHDTQRYAYLTLLRQWSLARMGCPCDTIVWEDMCAGNTPPYTLYIFPDIYYLNDMTRTYMKRHLTETHAMSFFFHAPGCMTDGECSPALMADILGVPCQAYDSLPGCSEIRTNDDPLLKDVPIGSVYGLGIPHDDITRAAVHPNITLPETVSPCFLPTRGKGDVLAYLRDTEHPGLIRWRTSAHTVIYSYAPAPPWQLMRNAARDAGAHIWCDSGNGVYADNRIIALHATHNGATTIHFPRTVEAKEVFSGKKYTGVEHITIDMRTGDTTVILYE